MLEKLQRWRKPVALISLLAAMLLVLYILYLLLLPGELQAQSVDTPASVAFEATSPVVWLPGQCLPVVWEVATARQVYLNEETVSLTGQREVCIESGTRPTLLVFFNDGTSKVFELDVGIRLYDTRLWLSLFMGLGLVVLAGALIELPLVSQHLRSILIGGSLTGAVIILGLVALQALRPGPVAIHDTFRDARVHFSADRHTVLLPGECLDVHWTVQGAEQVAYFREVYPGILGKPGTRDVFFMTEYNPDKPRSIAEAPGAVFTTIEDTARPVSQRDEGCIDLMREPKIRLYLADGSTYAYKPGIEPFFLKLDIWFMIIGASLLLLVAGMMFNEGQFAPLPRYLQALRIGVVISGGWLLLYWCFFVYLGFDWLLSNYLLESLVLGMYTSGVFALGWRLFQSPERVAEWVTQRLLRISRLALWSGILAFWLLMLRSGYQQADGVNPFLFLPLYLLLLIHTVCIFWGDVVLRPVPANPASKKSPGQSLILAFSFAMLIFLRDAGLMQVFGIYVQNDTGSYINLGKELLEGESSLGSRAFPYLFLNYITGSAEDGFRLVWLQIVLAAFAVGLLVYVLSRKNYWLGVMVGILFAVDLNWTSQNLTLLVESTFMSFYIISFAMLVNHFDRRQEDIPGWELFLVGLLYGWTLMIRPLALLLIVVLVVFYWVMSSSRKALWVSLGQLSFILLVIGFNTYRYGIPRIIAGDQMTTLSAIFGYHHFHPGNGPGARALDHELRNCMPDLDYDDVPRYYANLFIFGNYRNCVVPTPAFGEKDHSQAVSNAHNEVLPGKFFRFSRSMLQDYSSYMAHPTGYYVRFETDHAYERCQKFGFSWCDSLDQYPSNAADELDAAAQFSSYAYQLHLIVDWVALDRRTGEHLIPAQPSTGDLLSLAEGNTVPTDREYNHDVVYLTAWLLMVSYLVVYSQGRNLVIVGGAVVIIIFTLSTTLAAHVYLPRYGYVLSPFFALLSAQVIYLVQRTVQRTGARSD